MSRTPNKAKHCDITTRCAITDWPTFACLFHGFSENGCVREVASIVAAVTSEGMFRLAGPGQRSRGGRRGETSRNSSSNRISGDSYQNKRARVESRFGDRPPANVGSLAVGASYDHDGNADDNEEVDAAMAHAGFAHALGDHFTFLNVMRGWDGLSLPTSAAQPTPVTSSRDSEGGARDAIGEALVVCAISCINNGSDHLNDVYTS